METGAKSEGIIYIKKFNAITYYHGEGNDVRGRRCGWERNYEWHGCIKCNIGKETSFKEERTSNGKAVYAKHLYWFKKLYYNLCIAENFANLNSFPHV